MLEVMAIGWISDGWVTKQPFLLLAGLTLLIIDIGTDLMGFPT